MTLSGTISCSTSIVSSSSSLAYDATRDIGAYAQEPAYLVLGDYTPDLCQGLALLGIDTHWLVGTVMVMTTLSLALLPASLIAVPCVLSLVSASHLRSARSSKGPSFWCSGPDSNCGNTILTML